MSVTLSDQMSHLEGEIWKIKVWSETGLQDVFKKENVWMKTIVSRREDIRRCAVRFFQGLVVFASISSGTFRDFVPNDMQHINYAS